MQSDQIMETVFGNKDIKDTNQLYVSLSSDFYILTYFEQYGIVGILLLIYIFLIYPFKRLLNENSYLQKEDRCVEETRNLKLENYSYLYDMQGATEYTDSVIKYLLGGTGFRHSVNSIRFILLEIARDYGFEVNDIGIKLRRYSNRNVSRYTDIADEYRESNPEFGKPMSKKSFCKRFGLKKNIMFLKFNFGSDSL